MYVSSARGFLFGDSSRTETENSGDIYGNIAKVIREKSSAGEKERNDPEWHFESFSFLKSKFAFEGAMKRGSGQTRRGSLLTCQVQPVIELLKAAPAPGKRTVISFCSYVKVRYGAREMRSFPYTLPTFSGVRRYTRARNGQRRSNLWFTSDARRFSHSLASITTQRKLPQNLN